MKVLWLTNIPSPYRVDFFNELGKSCKLYVLFEKADSSDRNKSWVSHSFLHFTGIFLTGISVATDKAFCPKVIRILRQKCFDIIVVNNPATPTGILAIEYMKLLKMTYLIEGDGGTPKDGKGIKERYKKHLIRGAAAYFSSAISHDEYYMRYGARREVVYRYPFTSIRQEEILTSIPNREEKDRIRKKIGVEEKKIVLSVGRVIPVKGFDLLLRAAQGLPPDTGIYIVGGTPMKEHIELIKKEGLENIHFIEFMTKEQLSAYYRMADLFVLPTRGDSWGLVINEAMGYGLPVVTTDRCVAGLELVEDNRNGFLIPVGRVTILAQKIKQILEQGDLRDSMAQYSLQKIKGYTIEAMAARHIEVFMEFKELKE